ncbi:MAG: hypothetical protein QOF53_362 [Nocardioidaceae bacterium]|jgi:hypothetical protein|nr:hypothetical protein [Nocardioidaceae bacterium]
MSPVFRSRRRAEEFAALVERSAAPGTPVEVGVGMEQARLLELVAGLRARSEAEPTPRPAFTAGLRDRLMAEAATGLVRHETAPLVPDHPRSGRERRLVAAATVSIVLGGTAGMASAAEGALPGQALYPLKRGIEQAQVDLAGSAFARGRQLLQNASTRLDEVQGLLQSGPVTRATEIPHTLQDFSQQAGEGADLMLRSYRITGNPKAVATVRQFAASQLHTLKHFASDTPPKAHRDLVFAATTLGAIDGNARVACDDCADIAPLHVPLTLKHHGSEPTALQLTGATSDTPAVVADVPPEAPGGDPARVIALIGLAPPLGLPPVDTALPLGAPATAPAPAGPVDQAATPAADPVVSAPAPAAEVPSTPAPSDAAPVPATPSAPEASAPAPSAPAPSDQAPSDPAPSVPPTPAPAPSVPAPSVPDPTDAAPTEPPPSDPPSQNVAPSVAEPSPAASSGASSAQPGGAAQEPAGGSAPSGLKSSQVPKSQ